MAGTKLKRRQLGPLGIVDADIAASANIAISKISGLQSALNSKENSFSKGNILPGVGVSLTGTGIGRLVGSGDITVAVSGIDASKVLTGTFVIDRIPTLPASRITTGIFDADRLPIATASALGGVKVGSGLSINSTTGVLSAQQPEGSLSLIDQITWTEFSTPNGSVHPLDVGYYTLTVSTSEETGGGPKAGSYTMVVYDRQVGGSGAGAGTVFIQHQSKGWCYNIYQDYGGNIRIYPVSSGETIRMFAGENQTVGTGEETLWDVPLTEQLWFGDLLTHNGDRIEVEYVGSFLSSTGDKTIRVRVGDDVSPTSVFSHTFTAGSTMWSLRIVATRTGPTTVDVEGYLRWGTAISDMYQLLSSSTDAPFEVIRLTAQSSNPIQLLTGRAVYFPYFGPIDS